VSVSVCTKEQQKFICEKFMWQFFPRGNILTFYDSYLNKKKLFTFFLMLLGPPKLMKQFLSFFNNFYSWFVMHTFTLAKVIKWHNSFCNINFSFNFAHTQTQPGGVRVRQTKFNSIAFPVKFSFFFLLMLNLRSPTHLIIKYHCRPFFRSLQKLLP
jgi:hypothetical protein